MVDLGKEVSKQLMNQDKKVVTPNIVIDAIECSSKFQFLTETTEYSKVIKELTEDIKKDKEVKEKHKKLYTTSNDNT